MHIERRWAMRLGAAVVVAAAIPAAPAAAGVTTVTTPNPGTTNLLGGLMAFSPSEIWGVGSASSSSYSGCHGRTLTVRFDGTRFAEVPENPPTPMCASVTGVAGTSTADIWAVGSTNNGRDTWARHWNGATWSGSKGATIPAPPSGGRAQRSTGLNGVAALASNNVWAVGRAQFADFGRRALIEHYDGATWQLVSGPPDSGAVLNGISTLGPANLWAVGAAGGRTLVTHWNGKAWTTVPSPNTNALNTLRGVSALAPNDVWAVGDAIKSQSDGVSVSRTLIEHWNGSAWSVVPSPNVGAGGNFLTGVAARATGEVFAVGYYVDVTGEIPLQRTLWLRFNGAGWSVVPSPNSGSSDNSLLGVIAPAGSADAWAWGNATSTLAQRFRP
jgi:hypothetical protein